MTEREFFALPTILSFFPLTFPLGIQRWTSFGMECNDCKRDLPSERVRGRVELDVRSSGYRDPPVHAWHVTAYGLCPDCDRVTTAIYELHHDMTMTGIHPKIGEVKRWATRKLTRWERFVAWLRRKG